MLGCIHPMSSPMMNRMFGFACADARETESVTLPSSARTSDTHRATYMSSSLLVSVVPSSSSPASVPPYRPPIWVTATREPRLRDSGWKQATPFRLAPKVTSRRKLGAWCKPAQYDLGPTPLCSERGRARGDALLPMLVSARSIPPEVV